MKTKAIIFLVFSVFISCKKNNPFQETKNEAENSVFSFKLTNIRLVYVNAIQELLGKNLIYAILEGGLYMC